jgi:hypothetical protein
MPEQYSTVTTPFQKLLPLCADWQQHRSHRSSLKEGSHADFLSSANRSCDIGPIPFNTDKTELLWCATARHQAQPPKTPIWVGTCMVGPATSVCDLGVFIDANIFGRTHVAKSVSACFAALRRVQCIRRSIPMTVYRTLVVSL